MGTVALDSRLRDTQPTDDSFVQQEQLGPVPCAVACRRYLKNFKNPSASTLL
ncbi:hypothetical protein RB6734 [Rhodopirellula baltica SH 1]|uniref:Uncharacterized protein n=1 Tax=Rhodopirellula baltica (strain DSM 10527 / NCIMB 13988 / SH1) TaxID=243090 RepID=Q7UPT3_RHOBA|nr:hypothetical protein RB6734 [Rhodopirellula baltica SH 1]